MVSIVGFLFCAFYDLIVVFLSLHVFGLCVVVAVLCFGLQVPSKRRDSWKDLLPSGAH